MAKFFYVYTLQSETDREHFHTGLTDDLPKRVQNRNSGRVLHTAKWRPWRLKTYIAFPIGSRGAVRGVLEISFGARIYQKASVIASLATSRIDLDNTSNAKERLQGTLSRLRCALQF
jgi:predicted GIY-YIG superfamily endonuclease